MRRHVISLTHSRWSTLAIVLSLRSAFLASCAFRQSRISLRIARTMESGSSSGGDGGSDLSTDIAIASTTYRKMQELQVLERQVYNDRCVSAGCSKRAKTFGIFSSIPEVRASKLLTTLRLC